MTERTEVHDPLDRPATPAIPLLDALLCAECDTIVQAPAAACPACTSSSLAPLTRWVPARVDRGS